ncbi:MAG: SigB/SigF/SigG family RNA polymerase sigma factor [Clostridia bacterium]
MLEHLETIEFIKKAQAGDESAKTKLIEHNTPLIKSIIRRYRNCKVEYEDLMQLGVMGLVKAINNFDLSYEVHFSTYAVPMITGEIKRFIRDDGAIKVSRSIKSLAIKINIFIEKYKSVYQTSPEIDLIASNFEIEPQDVIYAMDSTRFPLSLYEKVDDDSSKTLMDKIPNKETQDDIIDKILIKDVINSLPERERTIIILRYYRDKTQSEIATLMGVSQVQISRLESKILQKIKKTIIA